ncbi:hypothetical protein D3C85_1616510 [compost metagenome]
MLDETVSALAMLLATVFRRVVWALMPLPAMLKTLARDMDYSPRRADTSPLNLLLSSVKLAWKPTAFSA